MKTYSLFDSQRKKHACAIDGIRPHQLPPHEDVDAVLLVIENALRRSVFAGYHTFKTSMTLGAELAAVEILLRLRREFSHIRVHGYLPCETQANNWPNAWRERYFNALARVDEVTYVSRRYHYGCTQATERLLLDQSGRLLGIYGAHVEQNPPYALTYAKKANMDIVYVVATMSIGQVDAFSS
ncbi:MAG: DUF1273 domain-containing protein [Clostridiales bacterium]|jgi:uncharacterized phage-like protein YoqJ|nr:DUF1273 domain-containing protein [Clostridiales bacterium]